jgi:uncharacterized membrane protein
MYQKIIPPYFSNPKLLNNLSGTTEIILGITLLIPALSTLLGNYRPVNSHFPHSYLHVPRCKVHMGLPKWVLLLRMPLQLF